MRKIDVNIIGDAVAELFISANYMLPDDLCGTIENRGKSETNPIAKAVFGDMLENLKAADALSIPVCQDTGMAVLFLEVGQDVHFTGGDLTAAINGGVRRAYTEGYMRCSVVSDPLRRENTGDNTPAVIHTSITGGDRVTLTAAPKGFGSENMSRIRMFNPSASEDDLVAFIVDTVKAAGSNACPPIVLGVGIGSDFEGAALLAKKALCRPVSTRHPDSLYAALEERMLKEINALGIGPQGFGGDCTALAVNIEKAPTHIAGLPVAVNVGCHVTRHASKVI